MLFLFYNKQRIKQMKHFLLIIAGIIFISNNSFSQKIQNKLDSVSYSLGVDIAKNLQKSGVKELNYKLLAKAMETQFKGKETAIAEEDIKQIINRYFDELKKAKYEATIKAGEEFLKENGKRKGVITTKSGLQYEVLKEGNGKEHPKPSDRVKVHYRGTLLNGKEFDSSYKRGQPLTFGVTQVIKGWTEALQLMTPGAKYKLYIPYYLAYGERGAGKNIGPYETLIFEVELLDIVK